MKITQVTPGLFIFSSTGIFDRFAIFAKLLRAANHALWFGEIGFKIEL